MRDSSRKPLAEAIFEIKQRHFGPGIELQPWGDSEIKGRHLFRATRSTASGNVLTNPAAYAVLDSPAKVSALVDDLGLLFLTYRPLIFTIGVDKPLWVDTELSTWDRELIQLSDIAAYSVAECFRRGKPRRRRATCGA